MCIGIVVIIDETRGNDEYSCRFGVTSVFLFFLSEFNTRFVFATTWGSSRARPWCVLSSRWPISSAGHERTADRTAVHAFRATSVSIPSGSRCARFSLLSPPPPLLPSPSPANLLPWSSALRSKTCHRRDWLRCM